MVRVPVPALAEVAFRVSADAIEAGNKGTAGTEVAMLQPFDGNGPLFTTQARLLTPPAYPSCPEKEMLVAALLPAFTGGRAGGVPAEQDGQVMMKVVFELTVTVSGCEWLSRPSAVVATTVTV